MIRCHPVGYSHRGGAHVSYKLRCTNWRDKQTWKCSECDTLYKNSHLLSAHNQCHSRGRCQLHLKPYMGRNRQRYIGPFIPTTISRPIRAGLLYGVEYTELLSLVASLLIPDFPGHADETIQRREERARLHVAVVSGYTVPELSDNCFWGDAIVAIQKRMLKRKRNNQSVRYHQFSHPFMIIPTCILTIYSLHSGNNGADNGSVPATAYQEPDPSPETTDDKDTAIEYATTAAAGVEPYPIIPTNTV